MARKPFFCLLFALLPVLFFSCNLGKAPVRLDAIGSDCSQWCESAYKTEGSRQICRQACRSFLERFRACLQQQPSCRKARQCALDAMREACLPRTGGDRETCTLGGDYAYKLSLDYCIDRAEQL
jgi:hypothetical protein